jgi:hypothetical protein
MPLRFVVAIGAKVMNTCSAFRRTGLVASGVLVGLLAGGSAFADDGVPIKITNDSTTDIVVTVYDLNASPRRIVVSGQRITGFSTIPISVTPGPDGMGHVSWTAITADGDGRLCGRANRQSIGNDAEIHVHADSPCSST